MRLVGNTDMVATTARLQVAANLLRRLGINAVAVLTDWGTVAQRRMSNALFEQGAQSIACFATSAVDFVNPVTHLRPRSDGASPAPGGPTCRKSRRGVPHC